MHYACPVLWDVDFGFYFLVNELKCMDFQKRQIVREWMSVASITKATE